MRRYGVPDIFAIIMITENYTETQYSAGQFTGILIDRGVLIAPVQRFHHNGTGYDRILSELVCPVYRDEAKHIREGSLTQ